MNFSEVRFSVASHAAWTPGTKTESSLKNMPALLRRRASTSGKMALEAAYRCLGESVLNSNIPTIFCSRHGECERSADLLADLVRDIPLSPTAFSLSVHNATNGLFSIARRDHSNSIAIAAGHSTIEHAVIEACSLLTDDIPAVLLVAYDNHLPLIFKAFQNCNEQPFAWAWLIQPPIDNIISLSWSAVAIEQEITQKQQQTVTGFEIFQFFIQQTPILEYTTNDKRWQWKHHD